MYEIIVINSINNFLWVFHTPVHGLIRSMAQESTLNILSHMYFVGSINYSVPAQNLPQILRFVDKCPVFRQTERKRVVFVWQLSFCTRHLHRLYIYELPLVEFHRGNSWDVKLPWGADVWEKKETGNHVFNLQQFFTSTYECKPRMDLKTREHLQRRLFAL